MSSRYSRGVNKATSEKNQTILKTLLNDPANKHCADCKTAQHPRWASWNIGVFLCIRCSGIHRGMGTHISKVRSVDLDSWTDMHLENLIKWGNKRANKYWEAKLPENYVPDDSKIHNFIKTKYDLKRWVSGPMPDPSKLEDDDTPLAEVKEKLNTNGSRVQPPPSNQAPKQAPASSASALIPDLLGGDAEPSRAAPTSGPAGLLDTKPMPQTPPVSQAPTAQNNGQAGQQNQQNQQKPPPPPPKRIQTDQSDSLLGLDFVSSPATSSPASGSSTKSLAGPQSGISSGVQRPDLKKSILSLYAKPQQPMQPMGAPVQSMPSMQTMQPIAPMAPMGQQQQSQASQNTMQTPSMFDSLTSSTQGLSLGSTNSGSSSTANQSSGQNVFDSLMTHSSASAWASSPTQHRPSTTSTTQDDEWESFTSSTTAHGSSTIATGGASTGTGTNTGLEDELFGNVWK